MFYGYFLGFFFLVFVLLLQDYKVYILKTFIALKVYIML